MSKLDHGRIVDEAMSVIEGDGEAALSMRSLAARMKVTPMALYRYFDDRDALLLALVERVSEAIELPELTGGPVDRAVDLALYLHDFLVQHPWMIRLISTGRLASPAGMHFPEGFLTCAFDAELDDEAAFVFYRTMFATILGQATITSAKQEHPSDLSLDQATTEPLPRVIALLPRWRELDTATTPRRVFRATAATLRTE
ncbi:MAG: TetR/AcrR family transcriptional regulator [Leucobacter sp.]